MFLTPETRAAMGEQSVALARAVDYQSAGHTHIYIYIYPLSLSLALVSSVRVVRVIRVIIRWYYRVLLWLLEREVYLYSLS